MSRARPRRARAALAGLALAMGLACGAPTPTLIIVEVHAALQIPEEVDTLVLAVQDAATGSEQTQLLLRLDPGQDFPLRVSLEPADDTPPRLRITVTGLLAGDAVGSAEGTVEWTAAQQVELVLPPLVP